MKYAVIEVTVTNIKEKNIIIERVGFTYSG